MKSKFEVKAFVNSMFGMSTVRMFVDFDIDEDPIEEFIEKARDQILLNCTSILHWDDINGLRDSHCLYVVADNKVLAERILRLCKKYKWATDAIDAINAYKDGDRSNEHVHCYEGKVRWGGWTEDRLKEEKDSVQCTMSTICSTLEALGYDPNDNDGKRRIAHNLGIDRMP